MSKISGIKSEITEKITGLSKNTEETTGIKSGNTIEKHWNKIKIHWITIGKCLFFGHDLKLLTEFTDSSEPVLILSSSLFGFDTLGARIAGISIKSPQMEIILTPQA